MIAHTLIRRVLEQLEWCGRIGEFTWCPLCKGLDAHAPGCELAAALELARVLEAQEPVVVAKNPLDKLRENP